MLSLLPGSDAAEWNFLQLLLALGKLLSPRYNPPNASSARSSPIIIGPQKRLSVWINQNPPNSTAAFYNPVFGPPGWRSAFFG